VVSGTPVKRPNGEWQADENDLTPPPNFGPEPRQDYELEFGAWIAGAGNGLGTAIAITDAPDHIFGHSIVNDWSSRGIQRWETMLGPFLGKSLSTTVSPWIVTAEALAPFHAPAFKRPEGDPPILPYLLDPTDQAEGGLDIVLEAFILTPKMRAAGDAPAKICSTNFKYMYWTWAQMLTHHSSNGCPLGPGDLIASGTCSGPAIEEAACLAETSDRGTKAWSLPNGETRTYLEDGDEVILRGQARRAGFVSIGFGENAGRLDPAVPWPTSLARAAE
jgi:fumarylacetoacetase